DVDRGGQEYPGEAQLLRVGVRYLHHAFGGEAGQVHWYERHSLIEYDAPGAIGDAEHRRVAVADQIHAYSVHIEWAVDLEVVVLCGRPWRGGVPQAGVERRRLSYLGARGDVAGTERGQSDGERLQVGGGYEPTRAELVQRGDGIAE